LAIVACILVFRDGGVQTGFSAHQFQNCFFPEQPKNLSAKVMPAKQMQFSGIVA